jgi:microfibrillar-associated protein 1
MASSSTKVGRDELAAMLGASRASDLLATAASTTIASGSAPPLAAGLGGLSRGPQRQRRGVITAKEDITNDVSRMDRAQAAALVARQFNNASSSSSTAGAGIMRRHRAGVGGNDGGGGGSMNNKRKRNYQLLVEENLMDSSSTSQVIEKGEGARRDNDDSTSAAHREVCVDNYLHKNDGDDRSNDNDTEEEEVVGGQSFNNTRTTIRKKVEARVIVKNTAIIGDGKDQRRRNNSSSSRSSSSESDSSNGSSSSSSKSYGKHRRRRRRRRGTNHRSDDDDSSSSSEEDEADIRRRRVRERAARETEVLGVHSISNNVVKSAMKEAEDTLLLDNINSDREKRRSIDDEMRRDSVVESPKHVRRDSTSSTSDDSSTSLSSDDSSSSSSSSSDESDHIIDATKMTSFARPVFVPKSQRGTVTDIDMQQKKLDDIEERKRTEAQKRAIKSRALVAEMTSEAAKKAENDYNNDGGDEFDTGETNGVFEIVPDDTDPTDENGNNLEAIVAERDAWEVRELLRILRDIDHVAEQEKERKELERRRALTDDERLAEDRLSGRYRTPGETRRSNNNKEDGKNSYLQRFHHRGAFYMDEDTLNNAGKDDVRHKAAEYARAATGEDKIDKSALPKVMQTKYFGLSGHSTKYQGLAKEDTTDKKMDFLPIRSGRR